MGVSPEKVIKTGFRVGGAAMLGLAVVAVSELVRRRTRSHQTDITPTNVPGVESAEVRPARSYSQLIADQEWEARVSGMGYARSRQQEIEDLMTFSERMRASRKYSAKADQERGYLLHSHCRPGKCVCY